MQVCYVVPRTCLRHVHAGRCHSHSKSLEVSHIRLRTRGGCAILIQTSNNRHEALPGRTFDGPDSEGRVWKNNGLCNPRGAGVTRWRCWSGGSNFIGSITKCHFIVPNLFMANQSIKNNTTLHTKSDGHLYLQMMIKKFFYLFSIPLCTFTITINYSLS